TPNRRGHMASHIERRKFLATLGGAAVAWPLAARAQQAGKLPTIGVMGATPSAESQRGAAFWQRLRGIAWVDGCNLAIQYRWAEVQRRHFACTRPRGDRRMFEISCTPSASASFVQPGRLGNETYLRHGQQFRTERLPIGSSPHVPAAFKSKRGTPDCRLDIL